MALATAIDILTESWPTAQVQYTLAAQDTGHLVRVSNHITLHHLHTSRLH